MANMSTGRLLKGGIALLWIVAAAAALMCGAMNYMGMSARGVNASQLISVGQRGAMNYMVSGRGVNSQLISVGQRGAASQIARKGQTDLYVPGAIGTVCAAVLALVLSTSTNVVFAYPMQFVFLVLCALYFVDMREQRKDEKIKNRLEEEAAAAAYKVKNKAAAKAAFDISNTYKGWHNFF